MGSNDYGIIITIMSLFSLLSIPFGNSLNNIRLLKNADYEKNQKGDFQVILLCSVLANGVALIISSFFLIGDLNIISILLIALIGMSNVFREYIIVAFRIQINYKKILLNNVFLGIGYVFGYAIYSILPFWELIFICGSVASIIYIFLNTDIYKEPLRITPMMKNTIFGFVMLFLASILSNLITYVDKIIMFPLMGADTVSIYFSASIFSKIISMGITPISSVMLTYLNKANKSSNRMFVKILIGTVITGVIGYIACVYLSTPILPILYPEWANESLKLIPVTSATAMLIGIKAMINPLLMKFCSMKWQLIISIVNITIYLAASLILYNMYGLMGFCYGILGSVLITIIIMIIIYLSKNYKTQKVG